MGKLWVVGIGPGDGCFLTGAARAAIEEADVICGYRKNRATAPE